ncbi:polysaccharide biosynthesis tyrosine autokinase [Duncaniella sp. C9]|uniref:GumC family protein n=1 Tax=Duncaniella sp. C9 TaxID=2530392 RepID=UPI0010A2D3A1|nr:polysaccharide biosynthesis tyrosine autokinase [Duncaniella sp. C9]QCD39140.1 polysaccharide biosynthesis tyrosine autokinase [Duncaniella sp. C9]
MTQNSNPFPEGYPYNPASARPEAAPSPQAPETDDSSFNLHDFFILCLNKWKWFVISIIIFLGLGVLYIMSTPETYTRTASVMINEDTESGSQGVASALSDIGLFQSSANVNNEMLAFQSPAIIADVIQRLGLQTDYIYRHNLKNITLYGDSCPVSVDFLSIPSKQSASMELDIRDDGKIDISKMMLNGVECDPSEMTVNIGDTVATSFGPITINPGPAYAKRFGNTIKIFRYSISDAIEAYKARLSENLADDNSTVIDFTIKDVSIQRADDFLNTLIDIYNEKWVDDKAKAKSTSRFIAERLRVIEQELGNVDSDIADFKGEHLVPDVAAASAMYMEDANENTKQQMQVSTQIAISKFILDYIKNPDTNGQLVPANAGLENPGIEAQINEFNQLQLERDKLSNSTGDTNPLLQDYDKNLRSMRSALVSSLTNQERALQTQLNSLIRSDRATSRKIASSPGQAKYLLSVERQQKVKEALYLYLLQKREENELTLAFTPYNTRIITPPMGSNRPTAPISRNILLICFALGILIPGFILFIDESMNSRLRNRGDLEGIRTPLIGEIPESSDSNTLHVRRWRRRWRDILGKNSQIEEAPSLLVRDHGRSIIDESFRMVRANLEFMTRNSQNRVIMVTSFNPGSGKSFISLNLAAALALKEKNRKVLIIDLDLRRASVSRILPDHSRGITDYISGATDNCDKYIQQTECPGLYLLPVGTIPPNPSELLYSDRLKQLIEKYRQEYDYIFLDCPPAELVADASIIAPLADITIFILRAGLLDRRMIPEIDRIYDSRRYHNFMVILNGTLTSGAPYNRASYYSAYDKKS